MTAMREGEMELYCDLLVAGAYFVITIQLLLLITNPKVVSLFGNRKRGTNSNTLFFAAGANAFLFSAFICLCGASHLISAICRILPENTMAVSASAVIMVLCAIVSVVTAIITAVLFPVVANALIHVELDSNGKLQLAESYMVEIVNMLKESVVVLTPEAEIVRGNDISRTIFGNNFQGQMLTDIVHREDRPLFERTLRQVLDSYDDSPVSIEYRIVVSDISKSNNTTGIFTTTWVESTFCRGVNTNADGQLEYDVKMITRNIDDRKRGAKYRQFYQDAKEREIVNEAKLRYISCVGHDLKTPLQSFCFTTELLRHTELSAEQSELLEQANVAVDLMKLTISQTMDISKALTGAKLVPRRIPVQLSSIIDRVRIIIHGYGKQVPVSFTVAPAINDAIITDEEWLWQMLLNLLTNACKYTDRGSIDVRVSLVGSRPSEKTRSFVGLNSRLLSVSKSSTVTDLYIPTSTMNLLFEVADTGVGIREELGFDRVYPYENGSKGLAGIQQQQVDFVFTDIQMPIMTGPEMVRRFRLFEAEALRTGTRTKRQLIVAVSANQPDAPQSPREGEGEGEGEGSGDFDFVCAKPLSREDLTRLLLQYLSNNITNSPGADEGSNSHDASGAGASASANASPGVAVDAGGRACIGDDNV